MKQCKLRLCDRLMTRKSAKGLCEKHYKRLLTGKDIEAPTDYDKRLSLVQDGLCKIPVGTSAKDGWAIVDEKFSFVNEMKWHLTNKKKGHDQYIATNIKGADGRYQHLKLHHFIIGKPPKGKIVDHKDRDRRNNTLSNLRFIEKQQNSANHRVYKNNSSGYIGAYLHKPSGGWMSKIGHQGKLVHIGTYKTSEEAARARDKVAIELHGEFAVLNFPVHN